MIHVSYYPSAMSWVVMYGKALVSPPLPSEEEAREWAACLARRLA